MPEPDRADRSGINRDVVRIVGQAEAGVEVTVDGEAVLLDEEDKFVYGLP